MRADRRFALLLCLLPCVGCGEKKSTEQLVQDVKSLQEKDRIIAVRLLGQRKGDPAKSVPALMEGLKDKSSDVRWSAAIGLGYYGAQAKDAIPSLKAARQDRDTRVREAAVVALSRIDPQKFPKPAKTPPAPGQ